MLPCMLIALNMHDFVCNFWKTEWIFEKGLKFDDLDEIPKQLIQLTMKTDDAISDVMTITWAPVAAKSVDAVRILTTEILVQCTFIDI